MNRLIEIAAMFLGGVSLFTVCFVGFVALSGTPMNEVAVIGKLFPAPEEESAGAEPGAAVVESTEERQKPKNLSDAAVLEASLGVLSAWTLPSPYSTSELRALAEELKTKREEIDQRERALGRRERAVQDEEGELEERQQSLAELRSQLEGLRQELDARERALVRKEGESAATETARWAAVGRVIAELEGEEAGKRLQEYPPEEAARILSTLGDDARASEILNQLAGPRWKEYVDAYTAERARMPAKRRG